jgi:hypothetical protein
MTEGVTKPQGEMRPPHEVQAPLYQRLGDELIALTPERWRRIRLTLDVGSNREAAPDLTCSIRSEEGYSEHVEPSAELLSTAHELRTAFANHGAFWTRAECLVHQEANGEWRFTVDYRYTE